MSDGIYLGVIVGFVFSLAFVWGIVAIIEVWALFKRSDRWFLWSVWVIQRPMFRRALIAHMNYALNSMESKHE